MAILSVWIGSIASACANGSFTKSSRRREGDSMLRFVTIIVAGLAALSYSAPAAKGQDESKQQCIREDALIRANVYVNGER